MQKRTTEIKLQDKTELELKYRQYALVSKDRGKKKDYKFFNKKSKRIPKLTDKEILSTRNNPSVVFSEKERFEIHNYKNRLLKLVKNNDMKINYPIKTANLFFFLGFIFLILDGDFNLFILISPYL